MADHRDKPLKTADMTDAVGFEGTSARDGSNDAPGTALEDQLASAVAERDANFERFARMQAEFDNYRKRAQREADQNRQYQAFNVLGDLLPGLDNLQRAVAAAEKSSGADELRQGVQLVLKQFEDILARHGAQPIEAVGQPFDPNLHQAIQQLPSADHPPMTVIAEAERGWKLHDRVLRPSTVVVSSGATE
jgi:molecular chaperone GrpE